MTSEGPRPAESDPPGAAPPAASAETSAPADALPEAGGAGESRQDDLSQTRDSKPTESTEPGAPAPTTGDADPSADVEGPKIQPTQAEAEPAATEEVAAAEAPAEGVRTEPAAPAAAGGELEELVLPSAIVAPEPLPPGTAVGPEDRVRVGQHLAAHGRLNLYAATLLDEQGERAVELREAPANYAGLRRTAEIGALVRHAMLPTPRLAFEHGGRQYLALDPIDGEGLERALATGLGVEAALSIAVQLAQVLRRLHQAGWTLPGLAPEDVRLGQPLRLERLDGAVRIGETPPSPLQIAGYSAPELARPGPVTGKEVVYSLGAILYRALGGQALPESGAELAALPTAVGIPGVPQILGGALAPELERVDLDTLYQQLLTLKQRLAGVSIALEVASGTSVGLNPTRYVNEDSCGYATWSLSTAEGIDYRALLVVADGMGGMEAGEVASGTALRSVMSAATATAQAGGKAPLDPVDLVRQAAPRVFEAGQGRNMGTTLTCVVVHGDVLTLGHVGDTRAYLLREGTLTRLTNDHSLVAAMVASGVLSKEEAQGHPDSNKVLRSLGGKRELGVGYVDSLESAYGRPSLQLRPGDWLLLCSDGIWGSVDDERIRDVLGEAMDAPTVARVLVSDALRAGAPDNVAVVAARCVAVPWQ